LKSVRIEEGFKQLLVSAKKLAEDVDIEPELSPLPTVRLREKEKLNPIMNTRMKQFKIQNIPLR
jgi:hypothetical protein